VIFLDTSAIYAMADVADPRHGEAIRRFEAVLDAGEEIVTHNYVLLESMALLQHRLGLQVALKLARDANALGVQWVASDLHAEAVRRLARSARRRRSLVDEVSFLVMRGRGIDAALAFDRDFELEGFRLYRG